MEGSTGLGMVLFILGGLAGAVFALPFKKVKGWAYESYWLLYAVFGLVVFPMAVALVTVPGLFGVIRAAPRETLALCFSFGALWGFGGLSWGLMLRYLGIGLGQAVGCGLCSALGTLIPPIVAGKAGDLVKDTGAVVVLLGVFMSLAGIVLVGLAGMSKEGELSEEEKKKAVAEFDFKKGMLVALFAGVASAGMNFGLQSGKALEAAALAGGVPEKWKGMPVLIVVYLGGFLVNSVWCLVQNARNKTFSDYTDSRKPVLLNVFFAGGAGVIWAMQFILQKMGEPAMGPLAYIGFSMLLGAIIFFASLIGIMLGEWKGVGQKTKILLGCGVTVLLLSIVVATYGSKLAQKSSTPDAAQSTGN